MEAKQQFVTDGEEQIVRYLLHEMQEEERSSLEERLVREPSFFEAIAATEDDMIMKYVRGDLEARLLPRFEELYLHSASKRARVDQARLFQQAVGEAARAQKPGPLARWSASPAFRIRIALYSAALVTLVLAVVLLPRLQKQPPVQHAAGGSPPFEVALSPGLARGGTGVEIALPAGTRQVQFELALPKQVNDASYVAILKTPERGDVWHGAAIANAGRAVSIAPANKLAAGDYTLELQAGGTGVADYYFRVLK